MGRVEEWWIGAFGFKGDGHWTLGNGHRSRLKDQAQKVGGKEIKIRTGNITSQAFTLAGLVNGGR